MKACILSHEEIAFLKKLYPIRMLKITFSEATMLETFKILGIVKKHKDNSIEVTEYGNACYSATMELRG